MLRRIDGVCIGVPIHGSDDAGNIAHIAATRDDCSAAVAPEGGA
jgi:hypothetical protein